MQKMIYTNIPVTRKIKLEYNILISGKIFSLTKPYWDKKPLHDDKVFNS